MSDTNRNSTVVSFPSGGAVETREPYEQPKVRLPSRVSPLAAAILAAPFLLYWLGTVAFTPAGMQRFTAGAAGHIQWLAGSPDGNRVGSFTLFGLGVVAVIGVIRGTIIRAYGLGAFGKIEFLLGTALLCGSYFEWHLGQIGLLLAGGMAWGAYILLVWGWRNIQNDQGPAYAPEFQSAASLPEQTIYGAARNALDDEIHDTLRDKPTITNGGYRFKE